MAWIHQPGNITHGLQATPIVTDGCSTTSPPSITCGGRMLPPARPLALRAQVTPICGRCLRGRQPRRHRSVAARCLRRHADGRLTHSTRRAGRKSGRPTHRSEDPVRRLFSAPPQLAGDVLFGGTTGGDQPIRQDPRSRRHRQAGRTFDIIKNDPPAGRADSGKGGRRLGMDAGHPMTRNPTPSSSVLNAAPDSTAPTCMGRQQV